MEDTSRKEELHRHETTISYREWKQYKEICKHEDVSREPKNQTAFLIRSFIKKNLDKIKIEPSVKSEGEE